VWGIEIKGLFVVWMKRFLARGLFVMRAGLYARVSKHDQHTLPLQREATHRYISSRGWTVVADIEDVGSGVAERPLRETLLQAARRRELDAIVVWRLDRWGRSLVDLISTLTELNSLGVAYEQGAVPMMFQPLAQFTFDHISLHEGDRVLDAACGTGIVTRVAIKRFATLGKIVGLDLNAEMLDIARKNTPTTDVPIDWQQGDVCHLPFPDQSFDVVLCQQGLQFVPDKIAALREMRRVLVPDRRLIFTVWVESPYYLAIADALSNHVHAKAATSCLAPYALKDTETVRQLVVDAEFHEIDIQVLEVTIRIPTSDESLFEIIASRSPFGREIEEVRPTIRQEVSAALKGYRVGDEFIMPWKTHLVQAKSA
jgi:ubiquinone/menaquinone biosynthesis C-methylase UbiE